MALPGKCLGLVSPAGMCRVQTRSCWLLQVDGRLLAVTPEPPNTRGEEVLGSGDVPAPPCSAFALFLGFQQPCFQEGRHCGDAGTPLMSACARPLTLGTWGQLSEGRALKAESPKGAWGHTSLCLGGSGGDKGPAAGAEQARKVSTDE